MTTTSWQGGGEGGGGCYCFIPYQSPPQQFPWECHHLTHLTGKQKVDASDRRTKSRQSRGHGPSRQHKSTCPEIGKRILILQCCPAGGAEFTCHAAGIAGTLHNRSSRTCMFSRSPMCGVYTRWSLKTYGKISKQVGMLGLMLGLPIPLPLNRKGTSDAYTGSWSYDIRHLQALSYDQ